MEFGFGVDFEGNGKAVRCQGDVFGNQAVNGVRFVHALLGQGVERQHTDAVFVVAFEGKGVERVKSTEEGVVNVPPLGALGLTYSKAVKLAGYLGGWPRPTPWAAKAADGIKPSSESRAGCFHLFILVGRM